uniref:Dual specificity protein phosphatase 1B n=1 Tax=Bactrocera latifrons TaxID=174628 RepID=A0A0K8UQU9_BACLA
MMPTNAGLHSEDHIYCQRQNRNMTLEVRQNHREPLQAQQHFAQQIQHTLSPRQPQLPQQQQQSCSVSNRLEEVTQKLQQNSSQQHQRATVSATVFTSHDLAVESVMPGIYLTKNFIAWNEENLRSHGFTHIIIIDKHIQELYYPSPIFKLSTENTTVDAFDTYEYFSHPATASLKFGKEFEAIDLNFGEKSYLTTVLPNCYRAVKFINKALLAGGTILVIDCNGSEQKCVTIVVAYLMYKHNINFSKAFSRLKEHYEKADLDRFYMTQLYEYEPILQVQRAQSRGQSCSREMYSAILKRKKGDDEETSVYDGSMSFYASNTTQDFFNSFNPLTNFNATTTTIAERNLKTVNAFIQQRHHYETSVQHEINAASSSAIYSTDDYAME